MYKQDIKKTWSTINSLLGKGKKNGQLPESFNFNNTDVTDKSVIANEFNNFFTNIGPKLASEIPYRNGNFMDYLKEPRDNIFNFDLVTESTTNKVIDNLQPKSSCGWDGISPKLIKTCKQIISKPLTKLINHTIILGTFPDRLKIARVIPIFKKGDKKDLNNYRPVSLLPSISKIYERIIHEQLMNYFVQNNILSPNQYGFRPKHSTNLAAVEIIDRLTKSLDVGKKSLAIFIDLSKAFDTLDHNILISKLRYYGLSDLTLKLMQNYMSGREQFVDFNDTCSDYRNVSTGVPQGSILGPLLFIIYINDFGSSSDIFDFILFADDATLEAELSKFGTEENSAELSYKINIEISKVDTWLKLNKLSINKIKTKYIIFQTLRSKIINLDLKIEHTQIECVEQFNFLGLTIQKHLNWTQHINNTATKISRVVGILKNLKTYLPQRTLLTVYHSLLSSHLNYQLLSWGYDFDRIFKLQKRAIRIISGSHRLAHTEPLFKQLHVLKLPDLHCLSQAKFIHQYFNHNLPGYFLNNFFTEINQRHTHLTRNHRNLLIPFHAHNFAKLSLRYSSAQLFNSLPNSITDKINTHSLSAFILYYKNYLLNTYSINCEIRNCYICALTN